MRIEYDRENDVAYIYLVDEIASGEAKTQVLVEAQEMSGEVILDLDERGCLLGIEVIGASAVLPPETLAESLEEGEDDEASPYGPPSR
ncbi:DUF2283 domain-containing protein [Streptosporangium carneum]|uniref:DUF2283 domain-containing protein n=1 Tax=Streptosporangium carneum TaxID=47481 RepID=A0A9W6HVQ5_9ACTN|nr:DUF2283 domain-containing protein [Streptosporangium carneum]GLK07231.1 hypothetical protein GCM10017600_06360 [Streptosporangium carneum]